jgi:deoxyribonuclease V
MNREDRFSDPALDALQLELSQSLDFSPENSFLPKPGDRIYTIDIRYIDDHNIQAGIDIVAFPDTHLSTEIVRLSFEKREYIPGYFSFYEGPVVLAVLDELEKTFPQPDLVIVDGHGLAHPRKFGLACYIGAKTGLPTIGIAKKNLLPFDRKALSAEQFATHEFRVEEEIVGVAIRLQEGINPVFISAGNRISLETAIDTIRQMTQKFRLPENMRRADQASRKED